MINNLQKHELVEELKKLHKLTSKCSHRMNSEKDLYKGSIGMMKLIAKHDGLSQVDLAKHLDVTPGTITIMCKRIEKAGFVKRVQDEGDRRITRIYITEKGKEMCAKMQKNFEEMINIAFKDFSYDDYEQVQHYISKIKKNFVEAYKIGE